jgi:hypothetical protein
MPMPNQEIHPNSDLKIEFKATLAEGNKWSSKVQLTLDIPREVFLSGKPQDVLKFIRQKLLAI